MSEPEVEPNAEESGEWNLGFKFGVRCTEAERAFLLRAHAPSWPSDRLRGFLDGIAWASESVPRVLTLDDAN